MLFVFLFGFVFFAFGFPLFRVCFVNQQCVCVCVDGDCFAGVFFPQSKRLESLEDQRTSASHDF